MVSTVHSGASDYTAFIMQDQSFGDQAGALLSGDAFDAILAVCNQAEKTVA